MAATAVPPFKAYDSPCLGTPDPDVAASNDLFATAIQWNAYFFNKTTGALDHMYKWAALRGSLVSDTHIVWDRSSEHWFLTTIVNLGSNSFGVQIMVSDAPAKDWKVSIPIVRTTGLIDDPQPTVTSDKVVITESGKCVWAVEKTALIAGGAAMVQPASCTVAQNNQLAAVKFGGDPPATAYAVAMSDNTHINWVSTEGPPATAKVTEHKVQVPMVNEVGLFSIAQGGSTGLESGQVKAMWQNNHLVWNKTVHCGMDTCVRSFDIDTAANTVKSDDYAIPGTQVFYGASGLDKGGNMWLVTAEAKPAGFVGLALGGRSANGMVFPLKEIVAGQSAIKSMRFGDYVSAAQDPVDGSTWLINEYAGPPNQLNPDRNTAACKVVHVTLPQ
jgi:hypothetical protein